MSTERRQNAKGRGVYTVQRKVLDRVQTDTNIKAYLESIEFACQGGCKGVWCVPFILPKQTVCGFC